MHTSAKAVKRHISYKYAYLPRGVIFAATVRGSAHWPVAVAHALSVANSAAKQPLFSEGPLGQKNR